MVNRIQLRRGLKSELDTLSAGEPGFVTDTCELYIGTGAKNVRMATGERVIYSNSTDEFTIFGTMMIRGVEYTKIRWAYEGNVGTDTHFTVTSDGKWTCKADLTKYPDVFAYWAFEALLLSARLMYGAGIDHDSLHGIDKLQNGTGVWKPFTDSTLANGNMFYSSVIEFAIPTSQLK